MELPPPMDLPSPPPTPPPLRGGGRGRERRERLEGRERKRREEEMRRIEEERRRKEEEEEERKMKEDRRDEKVAEKEEKGCFSCDTIFKKREVGGVGSGIALSLHHMITIATASYLTTCTPHVAKHLPLQHHHLTLLTHLAYVGPLLTGIVGGYVGGRGRRVRWVCVGMLIAALASGITALTALYPRIVNTHIGIAHYTLQGPYYCNVEMLAKMASPTFTITSTTASTNSSINPSARSMHPPMATFLHANPHIVSLEAVCERSDAVLLMIWILASVLIGAGASLGFTLGLPYLDDGVNRKTAPIYLAVIVSMGAFGHLLGLYLASISLATYVNPFREPGMLPGDSEWIGGWWMGQLVLSGLMLLNAAVFTLLPRRLGKTKEIPQRPPLSASGHPTPELNHPNNNNNSPSPTHNEDDDEVVVVLEIERGRRYDMDFDLDRDIEIGYAADERDSGYSMEEIEEEKRRNEKERRKDEGSGEEESKVVRDILKKRYITCYEITSGVRDMGSTLGRLVRQRVLLFSVLSDACLSMALSLSSLWLPIYLKHRFRMSHPPSLFYAGICSSSSMIVGVGVGGVCVARCGGIGGRAVACVACCCLALHALTTVALGAVSCDFGADMPGVMAPDLKSMELHRGCSVGCGCPSTAPHPVCVRDGPITLSYYSPCHAGCPPPTRHQRGHPMVYKNCTCGSPSAMVTEGYCEPICSTAMLYTTISCLNDSLFLIAVIASLLITLRCVYADDKPVAVGLKVAVCSLASLIAPPILNPILASSCLAWVEKCGRPSTCALYDTDDLAFKLHGGTGGILFLGSIFAALVAHTASDIQILDDVTPDIPAFSIFDANSSPGIRRSFRKLSRFATGRRSSGKWTVPPMTIQNGQNTGQNGVQSGELGLQVERVDEGESIEESQTNPRVLVLPISLMKTTGV